MYGDGVFTACLMFYNRKGHISLGSQFPFCSLVVIATCSQSLYQVLDD